MVTTGKATPSHHTPSGGGLSPGAIVGIIFLVRTRLGSSCMQAGGWVGAACRVFLTQRVAVQVLAFVGGIGFAVYWKKFRTPSSGDGYVPNQYNAL